METISQGLQAPRVNSLDKRSPQNADSKFARGKFIAWDGEGITREEGKPQDYVLFGCVWKHVRNIEPGGLSTEACLMLLWDVSRLHPSAIHVVYGGRYDFQQILKDATPSELQRINRGLRTFVGDFNVEVRFGKCMNFCYMPKDPETKTRVKRGGWVTLWDVFAFFQTSFVNACRTWNIGTEQELADMQSTKLLRNEFTEEMFDKVVVPYWRTELDFLERLMKAFYKELTAVQYRIGRWDGPGAIAAFLYNKHRTKKHMDQGTIPMVNDAAQCAYMGGRFEQLKVGHIEGAYFYDINSAYPSVMVDLPSLTGSRWEHKHIKKGSYAPPRPFSLYRVTFKSWPDAKRKREGHRPFPLWARNRKGGVQFGPGVTNWYWTPEYQQALRHFPDDIEVTEWIRFIPGNDERPFQWISSVYDQRLEYKNKGYGAERILKLGLNSLYGKMAQQVGAQQNRDGTWRIPSFHQLEWAGYVTSAARAKLFEAAMLAPDDIIAFETDAVFSTSPLDLLPCSKKLGDWGAERLSSLTYVQSGVSWATSDGKEKAKYRGFDAESLSEQAILDAWSMGLTQVQGQTTRFQSLGTSLAISDLRQWRTWVTKDRNLMTFPEHIQGRSYRKPGPLVGMQPCSIYDKLNDPGVGRPFYLQWKDAQYDQLSFDLEYGDEEL